MSAPKFGLFDDLPESKPDRVIKDPDPRQPAMSMSDDPFDFSPGVAKRGPEDVPDKPHNKDPIPIGGEKAKRTQVNHNQRTIAFWQAKGGIIAPCEQVVTTPYSSFKRDMFGCVDWVVVMPTGRVYFVQVTNKDKVNEHIKKCIKEKYKIGGAAEYPIIDFVTRIQQNPNAVFVMMGWHQLGGKGSHWECELTEVNDDIIESVKSRMRTKK